MRARIDAVRRIGRSIVIAIVGAALFRMMVLSFFLIPSQSMLPNLLPGDHILVEKWAYGWSNLSAFGGKALTWSLGRRLPERGDVVVLSGPTHPNEVFVKRVAGLPGDRIAMHAGVLLINGQPMTQSDPKLLELPLERDIMCLDIPGLIDQTASTPQGPVCRFLVSLEAGGPRSGPTTTRHWVADFAVAKSDEFPETAVPPGHLFLLGDNRDDSLDSRFPTSAGGLGMVPADLIFGKVRMIAWSTNGSASLWNPFSWRGVRWSRFGLPVT